MARRKENGAGTFRKIGDKWNYQFSYIDNRGSAICAKEQGEIVGVLLFSNENSELCFLAVDCKKTKGGRKWQK